MEWLCFRKHFVAGFITLSFPKMNLTLLIWKNGREVDMGSGPGLLSDVFI
jgi:hypothetical protein